MLCCCLNVVLHYSERALSIDFLSSWWTSDRAEKQPVVSTHLFLLRQRGSGSFGLDRQLGLWQARLVAAATLQSHHLGKNKCFSRLKSIHQDVHLPRRGVGSRTFCTNCPSKTITTANRWSYYWNDVYTLWQSQSLQQGDIRTGEMCGSCASYKSLIGWTEGYSHTNAPDISNSILKG